MFLVAMATGTIDVGYCEIDGSVSFAEQAAGFVGPVAYFTMEATAKFAIPMHQVIRVTEWQPLTHPKYHDPKAFGAVRVRLNTDEIIREE
jgi:hypothetical protein